VVETGDIRVDEIMPHLSESWATLLFEECLANKSIKFKKLKKKEIKSKGKYPVIDQGEKFITGYVDDESDVYAGTLPIIIFGDHTRRIKYIDFEFAVGADGTKLLHPFEYLHPKFFYYYLNALNLESQGYSRHYRFLKEIAVPIPSLNEQHRIVAKLEKLLQKVDACKERLNKIPTILKPFLHSILAAACSGRLTADLRDEHPDVKPATELLKQIQEERKDKRMRNPQISQIDMDELPDTWAKTKISDVYDINPGHKRIEIDKDLEVSFIPMKLIGEERGFMDASFVKKYEKVKSGYTKFIENDVLFAKITPCMENGKIAIAKNLCNEIGCGTTELHVFRPVVTDTNSFLFYFLLQKQTREIAKNKFQGTSGHLRVPVDFFEEIWFPLPPLAEQHEIVRRVEALFKIADQIEERYKKARAYVDKLTQSILAKAFRGELVPQNLNDEPASELLQRIKEERSKNESNEYTGRIKRKRK
jgi:type I restriction enzyme S subunit